MTEAERRGYNAGLKAARDRAERQKVMLRTMAPSPEAALFAAASLDELIDGLSLMMKAERRDDHEARRRSLSLVRS